eukprot:358859-Chlamydomonas_euryale.AAC.20
MRSCMVPCLHSGRSPADQNGRGLAWMLGDLWPSLPVGSSQQPSALQHPSTNAPGAGDQVASC